jgi:hypothetical protein
MKYLSLRMPGMKHQKSSNDFNGTVTIRLNPPTPSFPLETIKKKKVRKNNV